MPHLLEVTNQGIYCAEADVYIDPWKRVPTAIITHAHSDHAISGCSHYITHKNSEPILRLTLGEQISLGTVNYGEAFFIRGVRFSLHPAGHIIGSAQIRVEFKGQVWVVSGDYKLQNDNFCEAFEPIKCHVFITESTFALPVYRWEPQSSVINEITRWISGNTSSGKATLLMGYSLGKMQRLLTNLPLNGLPVYGHGAICKVNERLMAAGFKLPQVLPLTNNTPREALKASLILAPPGAADSPWVKRLPDYTTGYCSGWMAMRGAKTRRSLDKGFVLSDHADWNELNFAVKNTGAERVYVTHGYSSVFSRWLCDKGLDAKEMKTMYGDLETSDDGLLTSQNTNTESDEIIR